MKTRRKLILLLTVTALLLSLLTACGGGGGDALKGKWEGTNNDEREVTREFDGKGKAKLTTELGIKLEGEYTIDGHALVISMPAWDKDQTFQFVIVSNNLIMTNDNEYQPSYDLTKK